VRAASDPAVPRGLALVAAFVNTNDREAGRDALATPAALAAWLRERGLLAAGGAADARALARATDVREAMRGLLLVNAGAPPDPRAAAVLDAAAERAALRPRFGPAGDARLEPAGAGLDAAVGRIVAAAAGAMHDGTWGRLKACAEDGCRWAFYDASRNQSGRWCSMAVCGNRAKNRRAYLRRQPGAA